MPRAWSPKDERQFQHIVDEQVSRGRPRRRAAEIAGRTVNKQRRQEGRTRNRVTQGTGNPRLRLEDRSVAELRNVAADAGITRRGRLRKADLVRAIRASRGTCGDNQAPAPSWSGRRQRGRERRGPR